MCMFSEQNKTYLLFAFSQRLYYLVIKLLTDNGQVYNYIAYKLCKAFQSGNNSKLKPENPFFSMKTIADNQINIPSN